MKYKNKIFKEIIRYQKEKGQYKTFLKAFKNFTQDIIPRNNIKELNETELIKIIKSPLFLLSQMRLEIADNTYAPFLLYHHKKHMEENIKLFEKFLEKEKIKNIFFENVKESFLKIYVPHETFFASESKEQLIYNNLPPTGFIMYAFLWEDSHLPTTLIAKIKPREFWKQINLKWTTYYIKYINKQYND